MGNVGTTILAVVRSAFEEFIISIFDILLFLAILFGLTLAGYAIAWVLRFVFVKACRQTHPAGLDHISKTV
ncbi:envelope protein E [Arteriviridae sp.]|nr:envelope protein E [Arteriviridae sp.]